MFDNAPPNLPVEPMSPSPSNGPAPSPMQSPSVPVVPMMKSGKKEPEDIFSGLDQAPSASGESPMPELEDRPSQGGGLKIILMIFGGIVVLALVGLAVWMLFFRTPAVTTQTPIQPTTPELEEEQVEQPPVLEPQQPVTQTPSGVNIPAPEPVNQIPPTIPEPTFIGTPSEASDLDQDKLSDGEEAFYGTDGGNRDSDADGFSDGDEVQNLYSPSAPSRPLLAEGYMTPERFNGWSFSFPRPWSLVSETANRGSLTTGTAARFLLETRRRVIGQSLETLLGELHPGQGIRTFVTKNGVEGAQTMDGLLTVLAKGDDLLIVTYDLNGERMYEYRTSYAMFLNTAQRNP